MTINMGAADRVIRFIVGTVLILAPLFDLFGMTASTPAIVASVLAGIVLVVTASAHRQAAFESAMFLMDYLKTKAPFWKLEETGDSAQWVDARESDDHALDRWAQPHGKTDAAE